MKQEAKPTREAQRVFYALLGYIYEYYCIDCKRDYISVELFVAAAEPRCYRCEEKFYNFPPQKSLYDKEIYLE